MKPPRFRTYSVGNTQTVRTEIELVAQDTSGREHFVALIYDTLDGIQTELNGESVAAALGLDLEAGLASAKQELSKFVNRLGIGSSDDLGAAGLSLWLLEELDGTAMGVNLRELSPETEQ